MIDVFFRPLEGFEKTNRVFKPFFSIRNRDTITVPKKKIGIEINSRVLIPFF
jgi:hypothetical protein